MGGRAAALKSPIAPAEQEMVGEVTVRRWCRYGHNRLYVETVTHERLGWYDLGTGELHPERPARSAGLASAVSGWLAEHGLPLPAGLAESELAAEVAPVALPPDVPAMTGALEDGDLALRRAGEAVGERAEALRRAAPIRALLARVLSVDTEERRWRLGQQGERLVGARLAELVARDDRWRLLHSIPVGKGGTDIDHLVIGPGGVFTVNTKHRPRGRITVYTHGIYVNGQRTTYLQTSWSEASRAARLLSAACGFPVNVIGMVVPVNAGALQFKGYPSGCIVINRLRVSRCLHGQPPRLNPVEIEAIYEAARRPSTWRVPARRAAGRN